MTLQKLDVNKIYSYADYLKWNFEERLELIKGKIFKMSPAPKRMHQKISVSITNALFNFLKGSSCEVYEAPFDVRFPKNGETEENQIYTVVQPDICVICDLSKLDDAGCLGAPDLIVEILSKESAKRDLQDKFQLYEESGVKEYWVVYPEEAIVEIFWLDGNGQYYTKGKFIESNVITSEVMQGFQIEAQSFFTD